MDVVLSEMLRSGLVQQIFAPDHAASGVARLTHAGINRFRSDVMSVPPFFGVISTENQ